jgi:pimeloyl-ACP methyl ester carboxylesterase
MAGDGLAVLDALGVARAHVVGVCMGAMIAQRLALRAAGRVASLTSIMGSSGARGSLKPSAAVVRVAMGRPREHDLDALARYYVRFMEAISSTAYPPSRQELMDVFQHTAARHVPETTATLRQLAAIMADVERPRELHRIRVPTLVLHGADDPLVPPSGGHDTARRIPGAQLAIIPEMGHDLAPAGHPEIVRRILAVLLPFLAKHPWTPA